MKYTTTTDITVVKTAPTIAPIKLTPLILIKFVINIINGININNVGIIISYPLEYNFVGVAITLNKSFTYVPISTKEPHEPNDVTPI